MCTRSLSPSRYGIHSSSDPACKDDESNMVFITLWRCMSPWAQISYEWYLCATTFIGVLGEHSWFVFYVTALSLNLVNQACPFLVGREPKLRLRRMCSAVLIIMSPGACLFRESPLILVQVRWQWEFKDPR